MRESTLWGKTFHKEPSAELCESYMTTTIPIGEGIQFKGGLFVTPLGAEIIPNPGAYNEQHTPIRSRFTLRFPFVTSVVFLHIRFSRRLA